MSCEQECKSDRLYARTCVPTIILDEWSTVKDSPVLQTWLEAHTSERPYNLTEREGWIAFRQSHVQGTFADGNTCMWFQRVGTEETNCTCIMSDGPGGACREYNCLDALGRGLPNPQFPIEHKCINVEVTQTEQDDAWQVQVPVQHCPYLNDGGCDDCSQGDNWRQGHTCLCPPGSDPDDCGL